MGETGRTYGGRSADDRRADRRRRLLEAALTLVGRRGVRAVGVGDVCTEAGLAKRYFYEEFADIDGLVTALIDDCVATLQARVVERQRSHAANWPQDRIRVLVDAISEDPRLARLLLMETFGAEGSLGAMREAMVHRAVDLVIADFLPTGEHAAAVDERRLRMAAYALSGAAAELVVAWLHGHVQATADEIVDYLTGLFAHTPALVRADSRAIAAAHRAPKPRRTRADRTA